MVITFPFPMQPIVSGNVKKKRKRKKKKKKKKKKAPTAVLIRE